MTATSWTDQSTAQQSWEDYGYPLGVNAKVLLFGGALVMGGHQAPLTPTWTEASVASASYTEKTTSSTTWSESNL